MAKAGAEGVLVRAVFITNYRPRTGFMTPQKREVRGAGVSSVFRGLPLLIHHKCSFSGQLSLIFIRTTAWRDVGSVRRVFVLEMARERTDLRFRLCLPEPLSPARVVHFGEWR